MEENKETAEKNEQRIFKKEVERLGMNKGVEDGKITKVTI